MASRNREDGFTLVELLVTITIFALASVAMYQVLFSVARGTQRSQDIARVAQEARLGFNRMVRDTREGQEIRSVSLGNPQSFNVAVDFNADGVITPAPAKNAQGDYEDLTYSYNSGSGQVRLNGELLMSGVDCATVSGTCRPVFGYASDDLRYDWPPASGGSPDGVTTWQELDEGPQHGVIGVGNGNGVLDAGELPFVTSVTFTLQVTKGDANTSFDTRAQLRNNR